MTVLLATNNQHKLQEMRGIIGQTGIPVNIILPADLGFRFTIEEKGSTFGENAWIKATGLWQLQHGNLVDGIACDESPASVHNLVRAAGGPFPVLSDDSGIGVTALNDAPGIFSARFGRVEIGSDATDRQRAELLLRRIEGATDRSAHYTCNAVLITDRNRYIQVQQIWEGLIADEYLPGDSGFGYDPVFFLPSHGCTVSRLPQLQKDRISHRAKAVVALFCANGLV